MNFCDDAALAQSGQLTEQSLHLSRAITHFLLSSTAQPFRYCFVPIRISTQCLFKQRRHCALFWSHLRSRTISTSVNKHTASINTCIQQSLRRVTVLSTTPCAFVFVCFLTIAVVTLESQNVPRQEIYMMHAAAPSAACLFHLSC